MRNLRDDLKNIGVSEDIINHNAFGNVNWLLEDVYEEYNRGDTNLFFEFDDNGMVITELGKKDVICRVQNIGGHLKILGEKYGTSSEIDLLQDGGLMQRDILYGVADQFTGGKYNEIKEHKYMANGLESEMTERLMPQSLGESGFTRRVSREPNGYIAKVFSRKYDGKIGDTTNCTECEGYLNLDLRDSRLADLVGGSFRTESIGEIGNNNYRLNESIKKTKLLREDLYKKYISSK